MNSGLIPGGQKIEQKTDGVLHVCGSFQQRSQRSGYNWVGSTTSVLYGTSRKFGRNIKTRCIGSRTNLLRRMIQVLSTTIDRNHPLRHTPSLLYPESCYDGNWRNHIREKFLCHRDLLRRFLLKTIGWNNGVQKILEVVKTLRKPKQKPKIKLLEQWDLFWQSNNPVRVLRKSTNVSYLTANAPMWERWDLFRVVVSLERFDQDKDADKNVDADHVRTSWYPLKANNPSVTQCEEIDVDFRMSGLSKRRVVKWAMLSNLSCTKQFQKCKAQNACFIGIKE